MASKGKQAEQIAARKRHREQLKASRRQETNLERPVPKLSLKPLILIVCEGENTEPSYFNQFKLSSAEIIPIGEGYNTVSLVERANKFAQDAKYDQVWCVFDKDDNSDEIFNRAIELAASYGFGVAYSNQAFEYWLILHLNDHQGAQMHRNGYHEKINQLLKPFKITYDGTGSKIISEEFFEILDGIDSKTRTKRVDLAIMRAKRNHKQFFHHNPAKNESSTTVYELVRELLKYI